MSVIARRRCPCVIFIAFTVTISTCHLCHLQGDIVSCTQSNIYLWTINGELLVKTAISKAAYSSITCCTMSEVGEEGGAVWSEVVRAVWSEVGAVWSEVGRCGVRWGTVWSGMGIVWSAMGQCRVRWGQCVVRWCGEAVCRVG